MVSRRRQSHQRRADEATSLQVDTPMPASPPARLSKTPKKIGSTEASTATVSTPNSVLPSITRRTPRHKAPSKPAGKKKHPQPLQKTASTPYQDPPWLGFFGAGHNTEPVKEVPRLEKLDPLSPTPTKVDIKQGLVSPEYNFSFGHQSLELSEAQRKIMEENRAEAAQIRARMEAPPLVPADNGFAGRKIANARGKVGRFSDVHMAAFKKMDSIANHPSARRADTNRLKPSSLGSLKRSLSKAELNKPAVSGSLKRSPSKTELEKPSHLKRSPSKAGQTTPDRRSSQKSATVGAPTLLQSPACSSKRVKRDVTDDVTTLRPKSRDGGVQRSIPTMPIAPHVVYSNLLTPTKASLARSNSTKDLKTTMIPSISQSKSTSDLLNIRAVGHGMTPVKALLPLPQQSATFNLNSPIKLPPLTPTRSLLKSPRKIKSILRTPRRLYSDDPSEIAAGTHFATPPDANKPIRQVPATATVTKHVDFSASARLKAANDEMKAASAEPEALLYPVLPEPDPNPFNRRMTLSSLPVPGSFTFRSGASINFNYIPATSTIRPVRISDAETPMEASSIFSPLKRKVGDAALDVIGEDVEDNETNPEVEADKRQAKKMRLEPKTSAAIASPRKRLVKSSLHTLKGATKRVTSGLTPSRLNFLATPKKRT